MRARLSIILILHVLAWGALAPRSAAADGTDGKKQAVRSLRPLRLSLLFPDWTLNRPDSCCFPLPGIEFAGHVSPLVSLNASVAGLRGKYDTHTYTIAAGANFYLGTGRVAPYALARLLYMETDPDEGDTETFFGPSAGLGLEAAAWRGWSLYIEASGAALGRWKAGETDWVAAVRGVLGLGYRFGSGT